MAPLGFVVVFVLSLVFGMAVYAWENRGAT